MFDPDGDHNELEALIINHIAAMASMTEGSEEYTAAANQLKTLMEARKIDQETDKIDEETIKIARETEMLDVEAEKLQYEFQKIAEETRQITDQIDNPWRPSADQLLAAGTTFMTIAALLAFEMRGVITSKTFGWIPKPR